mmetsp:Transcript_5876/g.8768  ORF Transcript_5876/g.8768 Transcript_5876/m.8768 type:complete len:253 (+) Transcript_5876:226-984(+)
MSTMKSSPATKSASSSLVLLFRLIEANDWQEFTSKFLTDSEGRKTFQFLAALVSKSSSFNGMTILHACARFDPPAVLILRIIELSPDAVRSQDCLDRTPLHVAAGCHASTAVMRVLVDHYPEACMAQDKDGRTPLHMACDSSCELFEDDKREMERPPPSYRTIAVLLSAKLDSAVLEDKDGMSAIEYALCSDADIKTVRLIQRAAQRVHLKKKEVETSQMMARSKMTKRGSISATAPGKGFKPKGLLGAPSA